MDIIDSLVVLLQLDATKFNQQQKDAIDSFRRLREESKKHADEIEKHAKTTGEFFSELSRKILEVAAAYVGFNAVKDGIERTTIALTELGHAAAITGANAQDMQSVALAIKQIGGNADEAIGEIKGFIGKLTEFQKFGHGSPEMMWFTAFTKVGPNASWLDYMKAFARFSDEYKEKPGFGPAFVRQIGAGMFSDTTLAELMQGEKKFLADISGTSKLTATQSEIEAAEGLRKKTAELTEAFDKFYGKMIEVFAPAMEKFMNPIINFLEKMSTTSLYRDTPSPSVHGDHPFFKLRPFEPKYVPPDAPWFKVVPRKRDTPMDHFWDWLTGGGLGQINNLFGLEDLFGTLEGGTDEFVHPKSGAVGRFQIKPGTARLQKGFEDATTEKLKNPEYNRRVFDSIITDYMKKYDGDMDLIALAYHNGPGVADELKARKGTLGNDYAGFGDETKDYLRRLHEYHPSSSAIPVTSDLTNPQALEYFRQLREYDSSPQVSTTTQSVTTVTINGMTITVPPGSDGKKVASEFIRGLEENHIAVQANTGLH